MLRPHVHFFRRDVWWEGWFQKSAWPPWHVDRGSGYLTLGVAVSWPMNHKSYFRCWIHMHQRFYNIACCTYYRFKKCIPSEEGIEINIYQQQDLERSFSNREWQAHEVSSLQGEELSMEVCRTYGRLAASTQYGNHESKTRRLGFVVPAIAGWEYTWVLVCDVLIQRTAAIACYSKKAGLFWALSWPFPQKIRAFFDTQTFYVRAHLNK